MNIGKPGIVVVSDNDGTWTAGTAGISVNGNLYGQAWTTDKDTSMTALAALVDADADVFSAVYDNGAHTITITPIVGKQLFVLATTLVVTGTMAFSVATEELPVWASDVTAVIAKPDTAKQEDGFVVSERPPAHWVNYLFNLICQYIEWIKDGCVQSPVWTAKVYWQNATSSPSTFMYKCYKKSARTAVLIFPDVTITANTDTLSNLLLGSWDLPAGYAPMVDSPVGLMTVVLNDTSKVICYVTIGDTGALQVWPIDGSTFALNTIAKTCSAILTYEIDA